MNIEVVLTQDDPKLGKRGQVIKVSPGFANNFLIPQGKARLATPANVKGFVLEKERLSKEAGEAKGRAEALAQKLTACSLTMEVLTGPGSGTDPDAEKLYGAVTSQDIQQALLKQGISVDKKNIHLEEPLKKLGAYTVVIKLHPEVSASLKVWVVRKK